MHWNVLNSDYLQTMNVEKVLGGYHHIGLAPCAYDIYLYCKAGILPEIILGCGIIIIAYLILKNIRKFQGKTELLKQ